ncbi:hypothetical protein KHA93_11680 [Bacillus sp. FJAT-49732]|uniref:Uncharacterized protein n=2 Tax=Lederbergia citrisecunda TaxID=2833583 RepID=A0A942TL94_9BACI|nr:hypothetical protein [Lederbergia citrisecunda]MBS4200291.1 hypothetical protein [Lederbergia citrisecunda]
MSAHDFKRKLDSNLNLQLIVAGMAGLVDEGHSPHEVFKLLEDVKRNTFHALAEIGRESR